MAHRDHDPQVARWFTDVTFERLHALVDYYVGTGDLPPNKAFLFHNRLNKAEATWRRARPGPPGHSSRPSATRRYDYAPAAVADAMAKEATRLGSLL